MRMATLRKAHILAGVFLAVAASCCAGGPDTRAADVVVDDPGLEAPTQAAVAFWMKAGGGVDLRITQQCESGRTCIHVTWWAVDKAHAGRMHRYDDWNYEVRVADDASRAPFDRSITHELGHVFGLDHVSDPRDIMRKQENGLEACTRHQTDQNWLTAYGSDLGEACL